MLKLAHSQKNQGIESKKSFFWSLIIEIYVLESQSRSVCFLIQNLTEVQKNTISQEKGKECNFFIIYFTLPKIILHANQICHFI